MVLDPRSARMLMVCSTGHTVFMAVPYFFFVGVLGGSPEDLPPGRTQVRDRHLKFHEDRDILLAERPTPTRRQVSSGGTATSTSTRRGTTSINVLRRFD